MCYSKRTVKELHPSMHVNVCVCMFKHKDHLKQEVQLKVWNEWILSLSLSFSLSLSLPFSFSAWNVCKTYGKTKNGNWKSYSNEHKETEGEKEKVIQVCTYIHMYVYDIILHHLSYNMLALVILYHSCWRQTIQNFLLVFFFIFFFLVFFFFFIKINWILERKTKQKKYQKKIKETGKSVSILTCQYRKIASSPTALVELYVYENLKKTLCVRVTVCENLLKQQQKQSTK